MTIAHDVTTFTPKRQELLRMYLRRNGLSFKALGAEMGISPVNVARLCDNDTAPTRRVAQLRKLGIPDELLPEALDIAPGPKPKAQREAVA